MKYIINNATNYVYLVKAIDLGWDYFTALPQAQQVPSINPSLKAKL